MYGEKDYRKKIGWEGEGEHAGKRKEGVGRCRVRERKGGGVSTLGIAGKTETVGEALGVGRIKVTDNQGLVSGVNRRTEYFWIVLF